MNVQTKIENPQIDDGYKADFALWALKQARLIEEGRFAELDIANLVDEVESLGKSQKSELRNRLATIIEHLLKHRHGRMRNPAGKWRRTIRLQRRLANELLAENPSFKSILDDTFNIAWQIGVHEALEGFEDYEPDLLKLHEQEIPENPDFTVADALDDTFLPEPSGGE